MKCLRFLAIPSFNPTNLCFHPVFALVLELVQSLLLSPLRLETSSLELGNLGPHYSLLLGRQHRYLRPQPPYLFLLAGHNRLHPPQLLGILGVYTLLLVFIGS